MAYAGKRLRKVCQRLNHFTINDERARLIISSKKRCIRKVFIIGRGIYRITF